MSPSSVPLPTEAYVALLCGQTVAFQQLLRSADPDTPVPTCGDWTLHDLGNHLGWAYRFGEAVVRTGDLWREPITAKDGQPVADWYAQGAASLLATLETTDPTAPTWALGIPGTVAAFWYRRLTQDTAVHLVDAQLATGAEVRIDPLIAADGVDEVFGSLAAKVWREKKPEPLPASVALHSADTGHSWLIEPADIPRARPVGSASAAATVTATAAELLLALWKRRPANPAWITGDSAAANALMTAPLTL
jgi:uncharacterized protein (TIGR03083 family)